MAENDVVGVRYSELPKTLGPTHDDLVAVLDNESNILKATPLQNAVNCTLGGHDISDVGDGTVTGAIVDLSERKVVGALEIPYDEYIANKEYYDEMDNFIIVNDHYMLVMEAAEVKFNSDHSHLAGPSVQDAIDNISDNLTASDNLKFRFGKDSQGRYGYYNSAGTLIPFKNPTGTRSITANGTYDVTDYASANVQVQNTETFNIAANGVTDMGAVNIVRYANVAVPTIASVQRGSFDVDGYTHSSANVTISAVDMNRSLVICGIAEHSHVNNRDSTTPTVTGQMTSNTNITFRYNNGASGTATVYYTVITFANATVQRGYLEVRGCGGQTVNMNTCPSQKSFGIANCAFDGEPGSGSDSCTPTCGLLQVSEYQFNIYWGSYGTSTVHIDWQVITMA